MNPRTKESQVIEQAIDLFLAENFNNNDIVTHEFLKFILKVPEPQHLDQVQAIQFMLLSRVEEFKKCLLEDHHIALASIRGIGYCIVPPDEQALFAITEAAHYIRKGLRTGMNLLEYARIEEMTETARKRHLDTQIKMTGLHTIVTKERRDIFALFPTTKAKKTNKAQTNA